METMKKLMVLHLQNNTYQIVEREYFNNDWNDYTETIIFQGSLPECHSFIWLNDNGFDIK